MAVYGRFASAAQLIFLVMLAVFIVAVPFIEALPGGELINSLWLTLVLISGVMVIGTRRGTLVLAMLVVIRD
jgi:hypothetical protein